MKETISSARAGRPTLGQEVRMAAAVAVDAVSKNAWGNILDQRRVLLKEFNQSRSSEFKGIKSVVKPLIREVEVFKSIDVSLIVESGIVGGLIGLLNHTIERFTDSLSARAKSSKVRSDISRKRTVFSQASL